MVSNSGNYSFINSLNSIQINEWNDCAGLDHPFTRYEFLFALENSASASDKTGWKPHHYVERNEKNKIIALCPLYLKNHSFGEYIFDHAWADAYHRHGLNYYPKLQSAIPFTPVTGERLIIHNSIKNKITKKNQIINNIIKEAERLNISSLHFNFLNDPLEISKKNSNLMVRQGLQYHWKNNSYNSFKDYLETLSSRKRKAIKKERRCIEKYDLRVHHLIGDDIKTEHWDFFYECYLNTTGKKWGSSYLTKDFFIQIGEQFADKILLIIATKDDQMIAAAINFIGKTHLYGRLWGSVINIPHLHFELCYYQAIDFAIQSKFKVVEAGAQGEHKIQRGYLPEKTWSLHWIKNSQFQKAIDQYLNEESKLMNKQKKNLEAYSPFKNLS